MNTAGLLLALLVMVVMLAALLGGAVLFRKWTGSSPSRLVRKRIGIYSAITMMVLWFTVAMVVTVIFGKGWMSAGFFAACFSWVTLAAVGGTGYKMYIWIVGYGDEDEERVSKGKKVTKITLVLWAVAVVLVWLAIIIVIT